MANCRELTRKGQQSMHVVHQLGQVRGITSLFLLHLFMEGHMYATVEVKGQSAGSVLSFVMWGSSSGHQVQQQVRLPTGPLSSLGYF